MKNYVTPKITFYILKPDDVICVSGQDVDLDVGGLCDPFEG